MRSVAERRLPSPVSGSRVAGCQYLQLMVGALQRIAAILVAQRQQKGLLTEDRLGLPRDRRSIDTHRKKYRCPDRFLEVDRGIEDFKAKKDRRGANHQGQRPNTADVEHHDRDRVDVHDTHEEAFVVAAAGCDGENAVSHHDAAHQQNQRQGFDIGAARFSPDQVGAGVQRRNQQSADSGGEHEEVGSEKVADRHEGHTDQRHPDHPCAGNLAPVRPVLGAIGANHLGRKSDIARAL